jgi:cytochrome c peroxidase
MSARFDPRVLRCLLGAAALAAILAPGPAGADILRVQALEGPPLNLLVVPEPANLDVFVADRAAAVELGKALFWDMQVGSDGFTACATCHHHAGTDSRTRNTLHPGPNGRFDAGSTPNAELALEDFPFVRFAQATNPNSERTVLRDDRVGTQGVNKTRFHGALEGQDEDTGRLLRDPTFTRFGRNVRQSTGRAAPTVINAVFNYANFWDGRANHFFNGVDPFGPLNREAVVYLSSGQAVSLIHDPAYVLENSSLASQAVGPPLDSAEMSWAGRTWPDVGRKLLSLRPLAKQVVHPEDSVLGYRVHASGKGIGTDATTYRDLVEAAFRPEFWSNGALEPIPGYSQIEANFSLFFGLALQLYQATLVSDQTPFDAWLAGDFNAMSPSAVTGMFLFDNEARCNACHGGPLLTNATVLRLLLADPEIDPEGLIETMQMGDGGLANYDGGFYNIAVTPTAEDLGRGGTAPFLLTDGATPMPLSFSRQFQVGEALLGFPPPAEPVCTVPFVGCPPGGVNRIAVDGAFKTPGLRNVELVGPYMHNGSMVTLMQVVDFYARGGNFPVENAADLGAFIAPIPELQGPANEANRRALVDFMLALTDERVRWERAPFDHPQLFVADGHEERVLGNPKRTRTLVDHVIEIPAVGAGGRSAQMGPLRPFLAPAGMTNEAFHYQR